MPAVVTLRHDGTYALDLGPSGPFLVLTAMQLGTLIRALNRRGLIAHSAGCAMTGDR